MPFGTATMGKADPRAVLRAGGSASGLVRDAPQAAFPSSA